MSSPKMIREALCAAQHALGLLYNQARDGLGGWNATQLRDYISKLGEITAAIDRARPLGSDGVHGDRHTPDCGCMGGPWTLGFPAAAPGWCALCGEPFKPIHDLTGPGPVVNHTFTPTLDPKRMRETDLTHTVTEP